MVESQVFYLYSKFILHWGFTVRNPGQSATQAALPIPPPTTVVGFFAEPLLTLLGIPESYRAQMTSKGGYVPGPFKCALEATLAAAAGSQRDDSRIAGMAVQQEPSRLVASPYKTGGEERRIRGAGKPGTASFAKATASVLPVQAVGEAWAPGLAVDLVWIFNLNKFKKCLNNIIHIKTNLDHNTLLYAALSASRLGSREGLGSVKKARVGTPKIIVDRLTFKTIFYVPAHCVTPSSLDLIYKILLWNNRYELREYYVPGSAGTSGVLYLATPKPASFTLNDKVGCVAYVIDEGMVVVGEGEALDREHG